MLRILGLIGRVLFILWLGVVVRAVREGEQLVVEDVALVADPVASDEAAGLVKERSEANSACLALHGLPLQEHLHGNAASVLCFG